MRRIFFIGFFVLILQFGAFGQFDLGVKAANSGDFQTALQYFQSSIDKNLSAKKRAQIHYNIGVCFYRSKQADKAVIEFEKAVQNYPKYGKAFYALGMAQVDLKNWREAETAFRQSLKISNHGETWFDLALVLLELKNYEVAIESFQKAIQFGSASIGASHNNLGIIYALKGDFDLAEKELKTAEKLNFAEAKNNLQILRKAMILNEKTLLAKLILKEKND
jgi:tetratricopeptide (TPR) repeat protein